ncbi:ADP-ribosylation factor 4-like [Macrobrachium rosenbergii]|uniref:ADP-ribosylation factor 4-like n=1 Tax=Macrobrachium rosenbergii TaxID=79674 RepID=UPI0034D6E088
MGFVISRIFSLLQRPEPFRILMVGLDSVGKTTVLYKMKMDEVLTTIPTVGFNVESVEHQNVTYTVYDFGNQPWISQMIKLYAEGTSAVIFVVDSSDTERIAIAKEALDLMLEDKHLEDCPLLVLANKQDLPEAKSSQWITDALNLKGLKRPWFVQGTSALDSTGLQEAFDWLGKEVSKKE